MSPTANLAPRGNKPNICGRVKARNRNLRNGRREREEEGVVLWHCSNDNYVSFVVHWCGSCTHVSSLYKEKIPAEEFIDDRRSKNHQCCLQKNSYSPAVDLLCNSCLCIFDYVHGVVIATAAADIVGVSSSLFFKSKKLV